ncbi:MAG: nonstructural protein [Microviridae sp.]|nr:MAG: nonstructural protein [Microviridae sp.]
MKLNLYSIFDRKMNIYLTPFPARGEVDACRQISASFGDASMKQTPVGTNPGDFDLIHVGYFDDEMGDITKVMPLVIGNIAVIVGNSSSSTVPS